MQIRIKNLPTEAEMHVAHLAASSAVDVLPRHDEPTSAVPYHEGPTSAILFPDEPTSAAPLCTTTVVSSVRSWYELVAEGKAVGVPIAGPAANVEELLKSPTILGNLVWSHP